MSGYKMVNQITEQSLNYQIPLLSGIWIKYLESYCSCKWINLTAVHRDYRDIQLLCVYPSSQVFRGYFRGETLKHKGEKTYTRIPDSSEYRRSVYCEHSFHPLVKYQTIGQPDTYLPFEHLSSVVFRWFIILNTPHANGMQDSVNGEYWWKGRGATFIPIQLKKPVIYLL